MRAWAALAAILLAGCASAPATITVKVPVPVLCTEPVPERPAMPTDALVAGVDAFTFTKTAQAEIDLREAYEERLVTALMACRGRP